MPAGAGVAGNDANAVFPAMLAALCALKADPGTANPSGEQEQPSPEAKPEEQDGKRAALAGSFLNLSPLPVQLPPLPVAMNPGAAAPVQAKAGPTADQKPVAPVAADGAQLAFALVLRTPDVCDSALTEGEDTSRPEQAPDNPAADLRSAAFPGTKPGTHPTAIPIDVPDRTNPERREDAAPDGGSGIPRPLGSPVRIELPTATVPLPQAAGGTPAQEPPAPQVERPHVTLPTPPEQTADIHKPVQNLQIRLGEGTRDAVQVQISQQGSNIHVSVRSGDPGLAEPLRHNLPGLIDALERRGYHAEPVAAGEPHPAAAIRSDVKSHADQDQSGYGDGSGRQRRAEVRTRKKKAAEADFLSHVQEKST